MRRARSGLVLLALVLGAQSASTAGAEAATGWTAYVSSGNTTVDRISTATNTAAGPAITVGSVPVAVAITPDGRTAYVANDDGTVTPVDTVGGTAGTAIPVGSGPDALGITPNGQTIYVVNSNDNSVTPIAVATNAPQTPIPVGSYPQALAITPNGKTAYVVNDLDNSVTPINTATNTPGTPIPVGGRPDGAAITPDGTTLYVTNHDDNTVTPISTATNTPGTPIPTGTGPYGAAITPDGRTLYTADSSGSTVTPISTATHMAGTAIPVGSTPRQVAVTPDGKTVYAVNAVGSVSPINTTTNMAATAIPIGGNPSGLAITPDQAPSAVFSPPAGAPGRPLRFDGSASSSPVGSVVGYRWNFGDGQSAASAAPVISHVYSRAGVYTARLTVTNSAGTSVGQVFTGQTVSNQGGPRATTTRPVTISAPPQARLSALRVSPRTVSIAGRRLGRRCVRPNPRDKRHQRCRRAIKVRVSYRLTAAASVAFTFKRQVAGRTVHGRCVRPSRRNRRARRCTRSTGVRGRITKTTAVGAHSFSFNGNLAGRKLGAGRYQLAAQPRGGATERTTFKITS